MLSVSKLENPPVFVADFSICVDPGTLLNTLTEDKFN